MLKLSPRFIERSIIAIAPRTVNPPIRYSGAPGEKPKALNERSAVIWRASADRSLGIAERATWLWKPSWPDQFLITAPGALGLLDTLETNIL